MGVLFKVKWYTIVLHTSLNDMSAWGWGGRVSSGVGCTGRVLRFGLDWEVPPKPRNPYPPYEGHFCQNRSHFLRIFLEI